MVAHRKEALLNSDIKYATIIKREKYCVRRKCFNCEFINSKFGSRFPKCFLPFLASLLLSQNGIFNKKDDTNKKEKESKWNWQDYIKRLVIRIGI